MHVGRTLKSTKLLFLLLLALPAALVFQAGSGSAATHSNEVAQSSSNELGTGGDRLAGSQETTGSNSGNKKQSSSKRKAKGRKESGDKRKEGGGGGGGGSSSSCEYERGEWQECQNGE